MPIPGSTGIGLGGVVGPSIRKGSVMDRAHPVSRRKPTLATESVPPRLRLRRSRGGGFTLVEILVVVVILGILASVVIPQFTDASRDAMATSVLSQLHTVRSQIEVFRVQHDGELPDFSRGWEDLVVFSPNYLSDPPMNAFTGSSEIGFEESTEVGWVWDANREHFFAPYFDERTRAYEPE